MTTYSFWLSLLILTLFMNNTTILTLIYISTQYHPEYCEHCCTSTYILQALFQILNRKCIHHISKHKYAQFAKQAGHTAMQSLSQWNCSPKSFNILYGSTNTSPRVKTNMSNHKSMLPWHALS